MGNIKEDALEGGPPLNIYIIAYVIEGITSN